MQFLFLSCLCVASFPCAILASPLRWQSKLKPVKLLFRTRFSRQPIISSKYGNILRKGFAQAICAEPRYNLREFYWSDPPKKWIGAAEIATQPSARTPNGFLGEWTTRLAGNARAAADVAQEILDETIEAKMEGDATIWKEAVASWKVAEESLRRAATNGWSPSSARAIAVASEITAKGVATADQFSSKEIAAAWGKASVIWESASNYIEAEMDLEEQQKEVERRNRGLKGVTSSRIDPNFVILFKVSDDRCCQTTIRRTWNPFRLLYFSATFQEGTCSAKGFTEVDGTRTTTAPLIGETTLFFFKRPSHSQDA